MTGTGERRWVTSDEVARLAGVSRSAVSRCFTPGASIAAETRRRVAEAADRLGYRPNAIARSLNTRHSGLIGVVVADVGNPFYARLIEALAMRLQARGLAPLVLVARDAQATDDLLPQLLAFQVDGVIVASATLSLRMARLCAAARTPVVLVDRLAEEGDGATGDISADNAQGAALVADLFASAGYRRPAFIAGLENTSTSREREAGFRTGLARHGLELGAREIGQYTYAGGKLAAQRLLGRAERPDAIFCANDEMALAVLDVARVEFGLAVPGELAVAGFDNASPGSLAAYDLTTVDQGLETMADEAVAVLQHSIEAPGSAPVRLRLPCRLVRRSSTP
jgi:DNA-binding LacI/PurR family transcriptional regulator